MRFVFAHALQLLKKMATVKNWFPILDRPSWDALASFFHYETAATSNGSFDMVDLRNNEDRHPLVDFPTAGDYWSYSPKADSWGYASKSSISAGVASYAGAVQPSRGPRGTLASATTVTENGVTYTQIVLNTALPATVSINALADRGDGNAIAGSQQGVGFGFKVRIIGNSSGGSGKTDEAYCIANTSSSTPTITLSKQLSFTPQAGDAYEFLSGRKYRLNSGTLSCGDILTGASISVSSSSAPSGAPIWNIEDELYVPNDRNPGDGYFGNLIATASAAGTITGPVSGGDVVVATNEYRNFQIRIVQDTGTPTAAGQRRKISSHTSGGSNVYTLASNWTVTPSSTATFVIENANEIIVFSSNNTTTYTYCADAIGAASANTWTTTTYAARGTAGGVGCSCIQSWGSNPDNIPLNASTTRNSRHSFHFFIYSTFSVDLFDIAGGATGAWTATITMNGIQTTKDAMANGFGGLYDPICNGGQYGYVAMCDFSNAPAYYYRINIVTRNVTPFSQMPRVDLIQPSATNDNFHVLISYFDGAFKQTFIARILSASSGATVSGGFYILPLVTP